MDHLTNALPPGLADVQKKCQQLGFDMASDQKAGALLRSLVASKPGGKFLELGTGIGASLCWMLDGMDPESKLISIDNDPQLTDIAVSLFGKDSRLSLICEDGGKWIRSY
jgi:predicted O-methyltransferase YrrM